MSDTARDIITEALLDLGVLAEGEAPTAIQAAGALKKLNGMLDLMGIDRSLVYGMTRNILNLTPNDGVYTIGSGGDLDIPRPNEIISAYIYDTTLPAADRADYPLYVYNDQEWADQTFKSWTAAWPNFGIYFDYQFPFINAYTNPIPQSSQYAIAIYTRGLLGQLTLDQVLVYPPGYRSLIVSHLSIDLSPSYQVAVPEAVQLMAKKSAMLIGNQNLQINELTMPLGTTYYDIRSNRYRTPGGGT